MGTQEGLVLSLKLILWSILSFNIYRRKLEKQKGHASETWAVAIEYLLLMSPCYWRELVITFTSFTSCHIWVFHLSVSALLFKITQAFFFFSKINLQTVNKWCLFVECQGILLADCSLQLWVRLCWMSTSLFSNHTLLWQLQIQTQLEKEMWCGRICHIRILPQMPKCKRLHKHTMRSAYSYYLVTVTQQRWTRPSWNLLLLCLMLESMSLHY